LIVAKHREAVIVEPGGKVDDVGAEHEVANPHRLVARRVPGREQQLDRAVAEEIVIAVDEDEATLLVLVVARKEEVALDRRGIVPSIPLRRWITSGTDAGRSDKPPT
jgi:hypothetical protein